MPRATPFIVALAGLFLLIVVLGALDVPAFWTGAVILAVVLLGATAWQFANDGARRGFHVLAASILFLVVYFVCGGTGMFTFSSANLWNYWGSLGGIVLGALVFRGYLFVARDDDAE